MDYEFTLDGAMPLLMHADDVMSGDELTAWRRDPANKSLSVPGDDRSPPWTWMSFLYHDGERLAIPQECLMACLRKAGAMVPSKGKSTFKSMTQSGILIASDYCEFACGGRPVALADVLKFKDAPFARHVDEARKLGFDLLVKRAKVGQAKHVRVRAKFSDWRISGSVSVSEAAISEEILSQLFEIAGRLVGLGDWRPSAPQSPGPYGMFTAKVKRVAGKAGRKAS